MKFETTLKQIVPRTSDSFSFQFPRPAELAYKPGQFMFVTIKSGSKELIHHFSFSSSPTEKDYVEFTKKLTDSEYSSTLRVLKPGDWARIDAPYGEFTFEGEYPKIGLLTGGIGITPFRSICKYCTDKKLPSSIVLMYGCRSPSEIAFKDELDEMQNQNPNLKVVYTVNEADATWKGRVGFITAETIKAVIPDFKERIFFVCGPPGMLAAMQKVTAELGLPSTQLKLESFSGYK